jgi:hypothetical protein
MSLGRLLDPTREPTPIVTGSVDDALRRLAEVSTTSGVENGR